MNNHGGSRPGAGRPKGAKDKAPRCGEPSTTRNLTMRASVWALAESEMALRGLSRKKFFELAVNELARKNGQH